MSFTFLLYFLLIKTFKSINFMSKYNIYHMAWIEIYYFPNIIISKGIIIEF